MSRGADNLCGNAEGRMTVTGFRVLLIAMWIVLAGYTALVIAGHGMGLLPIFFGDMPG